MPTCSPTEAPRLHPTFRCRDAEAMIRWLCANLGFVERVVYRDAKGLIEHAELGLGSSILMLGESRDDAYAKLVGDPGRGQAFYVAVADPDALHDKVKAAGTTVETPLHNTPYGSRDFACRDPAGNLWSFGTLLSENERRASLSAQ